MLTRVLSMLPSESQLSKVEGASGRGMLKAIVALIKEYLVRPFCLAVVLPAGVAMLAFSGLALHAPTAGPYKVLLTALSHDGHRRGPFRRSIGEL